MYIQSIQFMGCVHGMQASDRGGKMRLRRVASLTAFLSFIALLFTIIVLYITPHGRIAYWSDWHLLGLDKTQWTNLHINIGVLFLLSILVHTYYNWKPITSYLRDKARRLKVFTGAFNLSALFLIVFALGTLFSLPPFSWVIDIS